MGDGQLHEIEDAEKKVFLKIYENLKSKDECVFNGEKDQKRCEAFFNKYGFKITNKVVNAKLTLDLTEVHLKKIGDYFSNVKFKPQKKPRIIKSGECVSPKTFNGVIWKINQPYTATFLIHRHGEVILTGCKTDKEIREVCKTFLRELRKHDVDKKVKIETLRITNIVASYVYPKKVKLKELETALLSSSAGGKVVYEPQLFPGLSFKMPYISFQIFETGKINLLGASKIESVSEGKIFIENFLNNAPEVWKTCGKAVI